MSTVCIFRRDLNFAKPARTSRGVYTTRTAWFIVYMPDFESRKICVGEVAPLYDLSPEYHAEFEHDVIAYAKQMETISLVELSATCKASSIRFAIDCIIRQNDQLARAQEPPLYPPIPINGLVWMGTEEEMRQRIRRKLDDGFDCIKLKIGGIDFEAELRLLHLLRKEADPALCIRLDANGAWDTYDSAMKHLDALAAFRIHSIEQPIRAQNEELSAKVSQESPIPIALDEELIGIRTIEDKQELLASIKPSFIVLKPSLHGGLSGAQEWIEAAEQQGVEYWCTSALESNIGLSALAEWILPRRPILAQGLGTGDLFTNNFTPFHRLERGAFHLLHPAIYSLQDFKSDRLVYGTL